MKTTWPLELLELAKATPVARPERCGCGYPPESRRRRDGPEGCSGCSGEGGAGAESSHGCGFRVEGSRVISSVLLVGYYLVKSSRTVQFNPTLALELDICSELSGSVSVSVCVSGMCNVARWMDGMASEACKLGGVKKSA